MSIVPGRSGLGAERAAGAHVVQFYERDDFLADSVSEFIGDALQAGDAGVAIATRRHRDEVEERLRARGTDPTAAAREERYLALDAAEVLAQVMVGGQPDPNRFVAAVRGPIARAAAGGRRRVRAFGEMVALLCAEGRADAAVRLEELWNHLGCTLPLSLLCAYPVAAFAARDAAPFLRVCGQHSRIIPAESYTVAAEHDRPRTVALLQWKATAFDAASALHREAERRYREDLDSFFENAPIGIHWVGADGIVLRANTAELALLGYAADEYVGHDLREFHVDRAGIEDVLRRVVRGETVRGHEARLRCKDGSTRTVLIDANGFRSGGRFVHSRCFTRDVTERRQAEAERATLLAMAERARAEAEAANRAKDELLAMLGHELRNPLAAVRNAIVSAQLDDTQRERALGIARRQTEQLGRLVDDLLDVARITKGRLGLRKAPVYLADVIERALESTRALVEDRGHVLTLSLPPDGLRVEGDVARLEQVVVNLLGNAAKHTPPGCRIAVAAERRGTEAVLRVSDDGVGIAPDVLPRVFDPFVQAERGLDRAQGGLGVGLTLARSLVELHGGRIEATSAGLGRGAEFVVHLPALPPALEASRAPDRRECRRDARARILVVEDNEDVAETLATLLGLLGHEVRTVHDGPSALDAVSRWVPDVILMDIGLPGIDGYEIARRVRERPELGGVTLVALTGYGRAEDRRRARAAGFDDHLVKPIDPEVLEQLVATLAERSARDDDRLH